MMQTSGSRSNLPKRMLIVKFGAIGDCVMAIPAARAAFDEGYEVHWVCGQAVAPVLALYPWVHLHVIDDRTLLRGTAVQKLGAIWRMWRALPGGEWDVCATLYYDRRYKVLTLPVQAKRKVLLSHGERDVALLPGRHHTDEYARILLGGKDDVMPTQLSPVPPPDLPPATLRHRPGVKRVVLIPGGARNLMRDDALRRWPVTFYVAVARELIAMGHEVVLSGGPEDLWTQPYFAGAELEDLTGKLSLVETLALLQSADVAVTHDTGPLHLAGLTACSIVGIFGPTDPHGRLPQRAGCVALWGGEGFACRPCYDGRDYADCHRNACIEQVTPAMVCAQVQRLLRARADNSLPLPEIRSAPRTPPAANALVQLKTLAAMETSAPR